MHVDVHFGMLRLGGTGSASVRERLVGPGKALEQARPHWQSQCHPAAVNAFSRVVEESGSTRSFSTNWETRFSALCILTLGVEPMVRIGTETSAVFRGTKGDHASAIHPSVLTRSESKEKPAVNVHSSLTRRVTNNPTTNAGHGTSAPSGLKLGVPPDGLFPPDS